MSEISAEKLIKITNANLTINESYDNFDVVVQKIMHASKFVLDCEATSYMEYDEKSKDLEFRIASSKHAHKLVGLRRIPYNQGGIAHKVLQTRKGIMINDITKEKQHYDGIDKQIKFHTRNLLAFPLFDRNKKPFGVIEACNKKNDQDFTKEDYQIFSLACQHIEQSLRNAGYIQHLSTTIHNLQKNIDALPPFICANKETKVKLNFAKKISESDAPLLITGEAGGGKRTLARYIHKWNSALSGLPKIVLCNEVVKNVQGNEQEIHKILFGDGKKKFHNGIMFQSEHRTIIFSEIWNFPISTQNDIVKCLSQKQVTYGPGEQNVYVNVTNRIVFTSSKDLESLVSENNFSEELYFHINALHIHIPDLHKRPDDVIAIAEYYFNKFISQFQKDIQSVDTDVYVLLKKYGWPHSVRELIEVIYRSVLCCAKNVITRDDILFNSQVELQNTSEEFQELITLKEAVDAFKKKYIYHALLRNNWNCTKTAKILDIQRSYLSRLVKALNLKYKRPSKNK